jgi:release factor glutamine methyltransferase
LNAAAHAVADRIDFRTGDLLDPLDGTFDLLVSNPPYVPDGDRAKLPAQVRDHEPPLALFAGPDGLDVIRRLIAGAPRVLRDNAVMMMEIGYGQAPAVEQLIAAEPRLTMIDIRKDLQGIPRTAIARASGSAR